TKIELLPKHIPGLQVQRLEFEAGGWHVGTPHTKGTRESFTTTLGKILISVEGEEFIVEKGDVLYFAGDSKHAYRNLQDGPSQGISIIALQLTHS
ncbi:MAG: cupin domain-containing protein, partial [bacterium]